MSLNGKKDLVVALGGGHGLAATLRALVLSGAHPVGVVSVADNGGSSGRLRQEFGLQPPGDVRKCLVALAESESVWTSVFDYRFGNGELAGHSLGNLIIAGLTEVAGDFATAIELAQELIGVKGTLYPSSVAPITLGARIGKRNVVGQVRVMHSSGIDSVYTIPEDPEVPEEVIEAIFGARTIVVGPGSLYTSVLAVLCVPRIRNALRKTKAKKVYIVNLKPQRNETLGLDISDHIRAVAKEGFVPDLILADNAYMGLGESKNVCESQSAQLVLCRLADESGNLHDPNLLAEAFNRYM